MGKTTRARRVEEAALAALALLDRVGEATEAIRVALQRPITEETRHKMRQAHIGKRHSEETRRKIAMAHKRQKQRGHRSVNGSSSYG
jgi:hypothetical protein